MPGFGRLAFRVQFSNPLLLLTIGILMVDLGSSFWFDIIHWNFYTAPFEKPGTGSH
jgi:hypothetical protein